MESTITQWLTDVSVPGDDVDALALLDRVEHGLFGAGAPRPRVGRYVLGRLLGKGGFGRVYEAEDPELARRVAVKLVAQAAESDRDATDDFLREGRALARVRHPHCVAIHDVGRYALAGDERRTAEATDIPAAGVYIVMELVHGQTLARWLVGRSHSDVLAMFEDLADALAAAHRVGVVHGDFKPANVAVDEQGRGRVLDFGLARLLDVRERDGLGERSEVAVGTPRYMAPEQHRGWAASPASDQFAWAAALVEAFGHELPFAGDTPDALAASKARGVPPRLARALPRALSRLLVRALAGDPDGRFSDMDALAGELRRARARGRVQRLALAGAAMAATFATLGAAAASGPDACSDASAISSLWNEEQRGAIRSAFVASGRPHAAATWQFVRGEIDDWTFRFAAQHERACRIDTAARVEQLACLDAQRWRVAGVLGVLRDGDAANVDDAPAVLAALPDPTRCAATQIAAPLAAPVLVEQYADVAAVSSLVTAGRTDEARPRVEAMLASGDLASAPAAEAWHLRSRAALVDGDREESDSALQSMSELATRERIATAETIALACRARSRWELGDAGGARAFAELARVRLAMLDEDLDAMLASLLCLVAYDEERGDGKAASEGYARLLDLAVRRHGAEHPSTLIAKRRLAQALYGRQMYDEAALALDDVGDRLAERLGSEHPAALDAEMLRALVEAEIGDRDAALRSMIDLQARYTRVVGPEHIMVATATYNVAVLHVRGGHAERALGPARRAYELRAARLGVDSRRTLESAGVLAMALSASDDRRGAMALLGRALANARPALGDRHPALLRMRATLLHFELADPRVAAGRVAEAEELLGDVEVHAPVPGALRTARAAVAVARRAAGEYDEALRHRAALHADLCAASGAASRPCRNASFDLARARLDAGDHDALAEARRILADQVHVDDPSLREVSAMHLALAEALERAGHRSEARVHYEAALPGLVVGGATGHTRARIAWGAARTLDRSLEDRRALARIARAQFVTEGSDADVEALDAWLETQR